MLGPMFGMDLGELVLILIIVVVVFGGTKLPGIGESLRNYRPPAAPSRLEVAGRWTWSDWLLLLAPLALAAVSVLLAAWRHRS